MAIKTFKEYLDAKGATVEKPKTDPKADTGPEGDEAPEQFATSGKNWSVKTKKEKSTPYAAPWEDKGQQAVKGDKKGLSGDYEKGFGDEGEKKNKVEYTPSELDGGKEWKKTDSWPKCSCLKSEVVAQTRELPMNEFSAWVREAKDSEGLVIPEVYAEKKGMNRPDPVQAIRYVTFLAGYNDSILEHLVREAKRTGFLASLVASTFRHPEAYQVVSALYESSPVFQRRLDTALEATDVPIDKEEDDEEDEGSPAGPGSKPKTPDQNMNRGDGPGGVQPVPVGGGPNVPGQPGAPGGSAGPQPLGPTGQTLQPSMMRR